MSFSLLAGQGHRGIARPLDGETLWSRSIQLAWAINANRVTRRPSGRANGSL